MKCRVKVSRRALTVAAIVVACIGEGIWLNWIWQRESERLRQKWLAATWRNLEELEGEKAFSPEYIAEFREALTWVEKQNPFLTTADEERGQRALQNPIQPMVIKRMEDQRRERREEAIREKGREVIEREEREELEAWRERAREKLERLKREEEK